MNNKSFNKILIIQTAFIGDVILATPLIEKLRHFFPDANIDFLVRKGNEVLLASHPHIHELLIWDKGQDKSSNLLKVIKKIRGNKYDLVINAQRFFSSGLITLLSGASYRIGFNKNPLSFFFSEKVSHYFDGRHEVVRNLSLISGITDTSFFKPRLYPSASDYESVKTYKAQPFITLSPMSVWYTKQFPESRWLELLDQIPRKYKIYLLGGADDRPGCARIMQKTINQDVTNLAGSLSLLQSAALMREAQINYVNDSAPMHLCSALDAPVCVVYCSTVPEFGYGPLSTYSTVVQVKENLPCRPCGIHGYKSCPQGHFKCALNIHIKPMLKML